MTDKPFRDVVAMVADYLGMTTGRNNGNGQPARDPVEAIATAKSISSESFRAFGATSKGQQAIVPCYGPDGKQCTTFAMSMAGGKGKFAAGKPAGLFLPHDSTGTVRLPKPGETWHVAEGVKDPAALHGLGLLACGLNTRLLNVKFARLFRGVDIVLVPDRDQAGDDGATYTASVLHGVASSVRLAVLPAEWSETGGADVRDVLRKSGGPELVLQAIADAQPLDVDKATQTQSAQPTDDATEITKPEPVLTCMADVEPRDVSWLWPGRVPLGRITLLVGRPGEGKSFLTVDLAARVTTGTPWPDGSDCPTGSVIFISAEDDPGDTIRPRLDAHRADVSKVHLLSAVRSVGSDGDFDRLVTLADISTIGEALTRLPDCKLLIVDPVGSFLGGKTDAHRDNEVRSVLAPIAQLAELHGVAVLVVAHRRKSGGNFADDLALGSRAFTGIARSVLHLTRDADNKFRRLLLPGKNNLAESQSGLAFSIGGDPPSLAWERDPVDMTADESVAAESVTSRPGPDSESIEEAVEFLRRVLAPCPRLASELQEEALGGFDISKATLRRAKKQIRIESFRTQIPGPWWWRLPADAGISKVLNTPQGKELEHLEHLAKNPEKTPISGGANSKALKLSPLENVANRPTELAAATDSEDEQWFL